MTRAPAARIPDGAEMGSSQREAQIMNEIAAVEAKTDENSDRLQVIASLVQQIQQELQQATNNAGANPPGQAGQTS